jgi:uncharacterized protein (DUF58 family)
MVAACLLLIATGLGAGFFPALVSFWKISLAVIAGLSLVDLKLLLQRPQLEVRRTIHSSLPVTSWVPVTLELVNHNSSRLQAMLHDITPLNWPVKEKELPLHVVLHPEQRLECIYHLYPIIRGDFLLPGVYLVVPSPLGFWRKKWFFDCSDRVKVFPNFRQVSHYTLLATHHHLSMIGVKKLLRRGEGKEFHQLREYRQGDEFQKIDWKATSRLQKLISREYQDERDQQIIFVLDSGRRMSHREAGKSHLDQALSSMLLLAHVASRQGDAVGLYCFGGTSKFHPPRKEAGALGSLVAACYDIQSDYKASDYLKATEDLLALQQRRSLLVVITNSRSEDYDDLLQMARQLRHKHLVVIADLRESILDLTIRTPIKSFDDALRYQALQHYLFQRQTLLKQLGHMGILPLDVTPEQLPVAIINSYFAIKSSGRL